MHRTARKGFPRNPYTVNNVGDLWELDLADMSCVASQNNGHKYFQNAIDAFSKYAYTIPIRSKTDEAVVSAFRSIMARTRGRKPLEVRTDKDKVFLNAQFRKLRIRQ